MSIFRRGSITSRLSRDLARARRPLSHVIAGVLIGAVLCATPACVRTYDILVDNRTVTSLTMRVYSVDEEGRYNQYPDRIFEVPPNREFLLKRAIVRTGHGRLFEFRRPDEQLVESFVLTYDEIERSGGRITVPRGLATIPRDAPPDSTYVDSTPLEHVEYIPLFPEDTTGARQR